DWLLTMLADLADRDFVPGVPPTRLNVILHTSGSIVSGTLVGPDEYFEAVAASMSRGGAEVLGDQLLKSWESSRDARSAALAARSAAGLNLPTRVFVHLVDVKIVIGDRPVPADTWRGTLSDVTGWTFGVLQETARE